MQGCDNVANGTKNPLGRTAGCTDAHAPVPEHGEERQEEHKGIFICTEVVTVAKCSYRYGNLQ